MEVKPAGGLVREMESKISILERSNFDLKMQIYYLNEKIAAGSTVGEDEGSGGAQKIVVPPVSKLMAERDSALESAAALKEANKSLSKKITELELLLAQSKTKGHGVQGGDSLMIEENRRKERSAMQAIAEHDAKVILELEETVKSLQAHLNLDKTLVSNCTGKISGMIEESDKKDVIIVQLSDKCANLQHHLDVANAKLKQQDLALLHKSISSTIPSSSSKPAAVQRQLYDLANAADGSSSVVSEGARGLTAEELHNFGVQQGWDELNKLRLLKKSMTEELEKRAVIIKTQEEALRRVKSTVEDITILEAEEIAKLEQQLESALNDVTSLRKKCRDLELAYKVNKAKADELERKVIEMESLQDEMVTMISDREELLRAQQSQQLAVATPYTLPNSNPRGTYHIEMARQYR